MTDLTDLSREIAATSDAWMVPGVQVMTNTDCPVLLTYREHGVWFGIWGACRYPETVLQSDIVGPDLNDPVTVNALLGDGEVWADGGGWLCDIADVHIIAVTRTEAIARAWIAAQKGG